MLTEENAQEMMKKMELLKCKAAKSKTQKNMEELRRYEAECIEKLRYFVLIRASKYRNFSNYEDLIQEGLDALLKAIRTFDGSKKGSFFFWAGLFVNTRLVRSANNHSAIRYPMHVAKKLKPHKESKFPVMLDPAFSPEITTEQNELFQKIENALIHLSADQREIISLIYGFNNEYPISINKACEIKQISRNTCVKTLKSAIEILKENIEI